MSSLRLLNADDLFLMRLLLEGGTVTATATRLGLTQPAITQRIRKIERVFGCKLLQRAGRGARLTGEGHAVCTKAAAALALLSDVAAGPRERTINVGARPEVGSSWLWPAIVSLRKMRPGLVIHCTLGSGEEILRQLSAGALDAVVSSAPHATRGYGARELAREDYVFVAAPEIARTVRSLSDLTQHVLVEHDRSFPFQRYVDAASRAGMKFRDVWFAGSSALMTRALVEGFGVGIVPEYLAAKALAADKLRRILPSVKIEADWFRLIFRQDRDLDEPMDLLSKTLVKLGLR